MESNALISVIVPVYNAEKYLEKCVDSILGQTHRELEIILVDDGSTDSSGAICDRYAELDARVVVLHKENGGQATARNMALDIAGGAYIGFVDSDDYIAPPMYSTLLSALTENGCEISVCARYTVGEMTGEEKPVFCSENSLLLTSKEALRRLCVYDRVDSSPCDKLFKKELFDGIRFPAGYICEDVDVVYRLLDRAEKIVHCGRPMYYYLQRAGSTSRSSFSEKTRGLEIYHKRVYEFVKEKHPELLEEAEYFYFSRLPILYGLMVDVGYRGGSSAEMSFDPVSAL